MRLIPTRPFFLLRAIKRIFTSPPQGKKDILAMGIFIFTVLAYIFIANSEYISETKANIKSNLKLQIATLLAPFISFHNEAEFIHDAHIMREIINKDLPNLVDMKTDFQKVNLLKNWVTEQSVWGGKTIDQKAYDKLNSSTALYIYNFVNASEIQLDCGVYSDLLIRVYELFGYEAYIYDMGKDSDGGHSIVLVRIKHNGKSMLVVEDPTYDITYTGKDYVEPMDFFTLLGKVKGRKWSDIYIKGYIGKGHRVSCSVKGNCINIPLPTNMIVAGPTYQRANFDIQEVKENLAIFGHYRYLRYADFLKLKEAVFYKRLVSFIILHIKMLPYVEFEQFNRWSYSM